MTQVIVAAVKVKDETGSGCQRNVENRSWQRPLLAFGGPRTGCLVGDKLRFPIGPLGGLRTSVRGETAPRFPRGFGCRVTYSVWPSQVPEGGARKRVSC